jgi:hypothetical protein
MRTVRPTREDVNIQLNSLSLKLDNFSLKFDDALGSGLGYFEDSLQDKLCGGD